VPDPAKNLSAGLSLKFTESVSGYGLLRTVCGGPLVVSGQSYFVTRINSTYEAFRFCYEGTDIGSDSFPFVVSTLEGAVSDPGYVLAQSIDPFEICPEVSVRDLSLLPGAEAVCVSAGSEYPGFVPVYLQSRNGFDGGDVVFTLVTLPKNGTLYLSTANGSRSDVSVTESNRSSVALPARSDNEPDLWYQGNPYFFTRADVGTYGRNGRGWNGCAQATAPGCPDTFNFTVNGSTLQATYSIQVASVFNPLASLVTEQNMTIYLDPRYTILTSNVFPLVQLSDPDDGVYPIGVQISTSIGTLKINITTMESWDTNRYSFVSCSAPTIGCSGITVYGGLFEMNYLLSRLQVQVLRRGVLSTDSIIVRVYKPASAGITSHDDGVAIDDGKYLPDQTITVGFILANVTLNGSSTSTDTGSGGLNLALLVMILLIAGPISCCFCACYSCILQMTSVVLYIQGWIKWIFDYVPCVARIWDKVFRPILKKLGCGSCLGTQDFENVFKIGGETYRIHGHVGGGGEEGEDGTVDERLLPWNNRLHHRRRVKPV
jgi:hypothetical protein